jgi:hypothetical protein
MIKSKTEGTKNTTLGKNALNPKEKKKKEKKKGLDLIPANE